MHQPINGRLANAPDEKVGAAPLVFENAGRVFRADTCEPLKQAAHDGHIDLAGWARGAYPGRQLPEGALPGIRSVGVWSAKRRQTWGLGEHCNEGLEVTYCLSGKLSVAVDGTHQSLGPNEVMVTAPWRPHEVGIPVLSSSQIVWFILDLEVRRPNQTWTWPDWVLLSGEEMARIAEVVRNSEQSVWTAKALSRPFEQIREMLWHGDATEDDTVMRIALNSVLVYLSRLMAPTGATEIVRRDRTAETVRRFLDRIDEHLSFPWRLHEMAKQCGVSRGVFIQKCKQITNRPPHVFLLQRRLRRSSEILCKNRDVTLTEIAMVCGFSSSAHFSYSFKKEFGVSPSTFRAMSPEDWSTKTGIEGSLNGP